MQSDHQCRVGLVDWQTGYLWRLVANGPGKIKLVSDRIDLFEDVSVVYFSASLGLSEVFGRQPNLISWLIAWFLSSVMTGGSFVGCLFELLVCLLPYLFTPVEPVIHSL